MSIHKINKMFSSAESKTSVGIISSNCCRNLVIAAKKIN